MAAEVDVFIKLESDEAQKQLRRFSKTAQKSLAGIESSFSQLKAVALAAVGVFAGQKVIQGLNAVTEAASIQENAINRLNTALALAGDFSIGASQDMQDFASQLQNITTIGDETTLEMLALAKSFGASNEQAKELVLAAADLSAATGTELESAVRNLGKTFGGLTGELGELVPATKELTTEQLKSGKAIKIISDRFGGAAQSEVNTYGGAVKQLTNTFGDFQEELGFIITQNPIVIETIKKLSEIFDDLIKFVKENRKEIRRFVSDAVQSMLDSLPKLIKLVSGTAKVFGVITVASGLAAEAILKFTESVLNIDIVSSVITGLISDFDGLKLAVIDLFIAQQKIARFVSPFDTPELDKQIEQLENLREAYSKTIDTQVTNELKNNINAAKIASIEFTQEAGEKFEALTRDIDNIGQTFSDVVRDIKSKSEIETDVKLNATIELNKKSVAKQTARFEFSLDGILKAFGTSVEEVAAKAGEVGTKAAGAFFTNVLNGAEGAGKFMSETLGAVADAFFPGVGGAVAGIVSQLIGMTPEAVQAQVEAFVEAMPQVIDALVENIPVFMIALAENADKFIIAIVGGVPKIIAALVEAMPSVAEALYLSLGDLREALFEGLRFQREKFFERVAEGAVELKRQISIAADELPGKIEAAFEPIVSRFEDAGAQISQAFKNFTEPLKPLLNALQGLVDSLSGPKGPDVGGNVPSPIQEGGRQVSDAFKNAFGIKAQSGGTIRRVVGKGVGDKVPSLLEPDETVLDRSLTKRIADFIEGGGNDQMIALLAEVLDAVRQPINVQTVAQVNGRAFADIQLELNRTNARVAV